MHPANRALEPRCARLDQWRCVFNAIPAGDGHAASGERGMSAARPRKAALRELSKAFLRGPKHSKNLPNTTWNAPQPWQSPTCVPDNIQYDNE